MCRLNSVESIHTKRQQLQEDRECLKKAKLLTDYQQKQIDQELEELRKLEIRVSGGYGR